MLGHTQGEWVKQETPRELLVVVQHERLDQVVANVSLNAWRLDECAANARLIAAAPALLEALEGLRNGECWCKKGNSRPRRETHTPQCEQAKAALAQATGGE